MERTFRILSYLKISWKLKILENVIKFSLVPNNLRCYCHNHFFFFIYLLDAQTHYNHLEVKHKKTHKLELGSNIERRAYS